MNWWARDAAGNKVQWTPRYHAWDINFTTWTKPDDIDLASAGTGAGSKHPGGFNARLGFGFVVRLLALGAHVFTLRIAAMASMARR